MFDVYAMLVFGVLGYTLTKFKINLPTIIVAFFLGPMLEAKFRQSLAISGDDITVFLTKPISLTFLILTFAAVFFLLKRKKRMVITD